MASETDENGSMAGLPSDVDEEESIGLPHGKLYPLNSRRLIAVYLRHIAEALSLPSTGSADEVRQLIEGKLQETREVSNVQVVVAESTIKEVKLSLMDDSGVFVEAPVCRLTKDTSECGGLRQELEEAHARNQQLREDMESVVQDLRKHQSEVSRLTEALEGARSEGMDTLESQLKEEKSKRKRMWRMHCQQVADQERLLEEKEGEVTRLRQRLTDLGVCSPRRRGTSDGSSHTVAESPLSPESETGTPHCSHSKTSTLTSVKVPTLAAVTSGVAPRRGKAPPIDPFSGENTEFCFEDWLPSLERAATWNEWSDEERLIQLAGHLRGKALQEWNLVPEEEKSTFQGAVEKMRDVLGSGSRVLAAQDFRHTCQEVNETVSAFVRRLERAFRVAHGCDKLGPETRSIFLFGQMQDGLRQDLMRSPSVSGALSYQELCMAAKNEEKRQAELKKRQEYNMGRKSSTQSANFSTQRAAQIKKSDDTSFTSGKSKLSSKGNRKQVRCYNCNKIGHYSSECRVPKTESRGDKPKVSAKQVTTSASTSSQAPKEDPRALLHSDSDSEPVQMVTITDQGSKTHRARVMVQGVPAKGVIDTGAEITILGGELFRKVASANRLKKRDFKPPDKTPRTYNQQVFSLDGRIALDLTFGETTMKTMVYVKMDATEQLLLGEGVCRQLGIVTYHPDVKRCLETVETSDAAVQVPTVRVQLLKSVSIPPRESICVAVKTTSSLRDQDTMMLDSDPDLTPDGVQVSPSLLNGGDGGVSVVLCNHSGFTCRLEKDQDIGTLEEVEPVTVTSPPESDVQSTLTHATVLVRNVKSPAREEERRQKLCEIFQEDPDLPDETQGHLLELLKEHHECFCLEENERGETDLVQFEIDTGDAPPRKQRPRRMPFAVREQVSRQLCTMQETGVIQPSRSPWSSPVVLVRKRDGSHRFCVDYRELNAVTKPDSFPLPRIDDLLDQLGSTQYFSTLDLAAGYWQIRMHPASREKTAFVTHEGLHEFRVMPFGLTNAPAAFQRLMQQVLMGLNPENGNLFVSVYIDDVLIFSKSLEDHLHHLGLVMKRLMEVNLKLKPSKCQFLRREVEYLGYLITPEGLKTSQRHILAVQEFPQPRDVKGVRRFLGLASYYRRFIQSFAKIAQPLHALTRKNVEFEWTEKCQQSFDNLKGRLSAAPVLAYPNFQQRFIVETDASIQGLGSVLSQRQEDGKLHPIAYASRALSPGERNYGITELETLAVVWAVTHFRAYLYGSCVTVYTDHSAVKSVLLDPHATGKHARWWSRVFNSGIKEIEIIYRPGKENACADALSRCPHAPAPAEGIAEAKAQVLLCEVDEIEQLLALNPEKDTLVTGFSLKEEQEKDMKLREIRDYICSGALPQDDKQAHKLVVQAQLFTVVDDVLYYVDPHRKNQQKAVVPNHLKIKVMENNHGGPFGGHFAGNRLFKMLARNWWWDGMYKDCIQYCRSCPDCTFVSGGGKPGKPPLKPIPVSRPFQILGIDIMELPKTEKGNRYVLVMQDFLTKWPFVFPMPDQKTTRIVRLLVDEVIPLIGVPEALLSDRGTNLLSHLMRDVCALLGIEKLNTTAYHPQCDGLTERFNRTLKSLLRKHAVKFGQQWDRHLPAVLWAYRNVPHESTGEKPSFLLFGTDCRSPTDAAILPSIPVEPVDLSDYREELVATLSSARELAAAAVKKAQTKYKKYYDRNTRPLTHRVGDWVLIRFPPEETGRQRKLSKPWYGPYRVTAVTETGVTAVKVYSPQDGTISVHASRVTRCPPAFPAGSYWYGGRRSGPGRPPRWVDQLVQDDTDQASLEAGMADPEAEGTNSETEGSPSDDERMFMNREDDLEDALPGRDPELERPSPPSVTSTGTRRSTRKASRPNYYGSFIPT